MERLLKEVTGGGARLDRIVEFVDRHLAMDVVYVSELRDGRQAYRAVAGDAESFGIAVGEGLPAEATYDRLMLAGAISNVVCDAAADERVGGLAVTRAVGIGCYVGVPIRRVDGSLYGTLSAAGHAANHSLDERTVRLLSLLGELIVDDVDEQSKRDEVRRSILGFVEHRDFAVAYQPVFGLSDGRCVGVEALARFPEPFHRPDQTFAVAAKVGLGVELEDAAARRAGEIIPRLAAGQFLAINASPAALLSLERQAGRGGRHLLSKVVIEITEHSVIEAYATLRDQLAPLRAQGLRIAVDDAGAGYASLRHILELQPDFIKLDRCLIDGLADDRGRRVAVSAFLSLARELGSSVIAEGVERPEDLTAVCELGLDGAQGYLLGGPSLDPDEVSGWCAAGDGRRAAAFGGLLLDRCSVRADAVSDRSVSAAGFGASSASADRGVVGRELERWELDRRVSQRLEAVGQLAAGIAHEINTPLQFVGDSVTFLREAVDELVTLTGLYRETLNAETPIPVEQRRQAMSEAEQRADVEYLCQRIPAAFERTVDGITRVREIVQAMKRFSHASGTESAPADLNEAIETTLAVCRNEYKYVAQIELDLGELPPVVCNIGELNQVFLNLIINAAQAIEEQHAGNGELGQIGICTRVDGDAVLIEVADDGPGIPPALRDRIFEPFFTTKEIGKGTGQGLALALATVERHAGSIECVSAPGGGTRFCIRLPLHHAAPPTELAA